VSLAKPTLGEILDRLTILSLKVLHGRQAGKAVGHFEEEQRVLATLECAKRPHGLSHLPLLDLAAVNAALWHAEDDLREYRIKVREFDEHAALAVAFRIQDLNDQRACLIQEINKASGEWQGAEKAHAGD